MKKNFMIFIVCFVFLILTGCRIYSMGVMENPEFKKGMTPTDLDEKLLEKYTIGKVTVQPRITYADPAQTKFKLLIVFFSKTTSSVVSINTVTLSINGQRFDYGEQIVNKKSISNWELYPANEPFYVCSVRGKPIDLLKDKIIQSRIDVSLNVSIEEEGEKVITKKIDSYFIGEKKSFLE